MGRDLPGFDRRTVLKTAGAGVVSGAVYSSSGGADNDTRNRRRKAPNIWVYDTSGREHTFDVTVRKHPPSGEEVTFDRTIDLPPRGEKTFDKGFGDRRHRHSAVVRVDDERRHHSDVTPVAKNGRRYGLMIKSGGDDSISVGVVHADPPEAK